ASARARRTAPTSRRTRPSSSAQHCHTRMRTSSATCSEGGRPSCTMTPLRLRTAVGEAQPKTRKMRMHRSKWEPSKGSQTLPRCYAASKARRLHTRSLSRKSWLRSGLGGLGLATLAGCANLIAGGGGVHRSDSFPSGNAPEPTVATNVLSCVAKPLPYGSGDSLTARFDALARGAIPAQAVPLSRTAHDALCDTIAASGNFHAYREPPSASAQAVISELAQATGAKSIAIPAMRLYARCEEDKKTVRNSSGQVIAT